MNEPTRSAVVTGGASGLGWATALSLAERGTTVVVADLQDPSSLGHDHPRIKFVDTDVTDESSVQRAVGAATGFGPVRVAVSCAGIGAGMTTVRKDGRPHSTRVFDRIIAVNLAGTFHLLTQAAASMAANEPVDDDGSRGVIVTTASIAAFEGQRGQLAYGAAKAAVVGMTLPAARDLVRSGIRVVCVAPGSIETPLLGQLNDEQRLGLVQDAAHPRRLGRPEEYASLVQHVVDNPYLNGTVIRLDAGLRMGSE